MPWWILALIGVSVASPLYIWGLLRDAPPGQRALRLAPYCLGVLSAPLIVPAAYPLPRFVLGMVALVSASKAVEIARGRATDPEMVASFQRFLSWVTIPLDTCWPRSDEEAAAARAEGRVRLRDGAIKGLGLLGLAGLNTAWPALQDHWFTRLYWTGWSFYLIFAGATDIALGLRMQSGVQVGRLFDAPFLARSPRDFWSRRWNRWFRHWTHRHIFADLGDRRILGAALVFVVSAAVHEYLVLIALGRTGGHMTAFFLLHGAATIGAVVFGQRFGRKTWMPAPAAVALHTVWMVATSALFFEPVLQVFPIAGMRFGA